MDQRMVGEEKALMTPAVHRGSPAAALVVASSLAMLGGCGGAGTEPSFAIVGIQGDAGDAEASATNASPSLADSGARPTLFLPSEAGPAAPTGACKPGAYSGMFTTNVTIPDAGLLSDLFSNIISWDGTLSLTLEGEMSTTQNGEFSATTLVIAPGGKLSGSDQYGGMFNATVSGQLDCPSRTLAGMLQNGTYTNSTYLGLFGDGGTVTMVGTLSGTYDPNTTPVALDNGSISASSPDIQGLEADGAWSATLQ
jgi:hypothetical protein